MPLLAAPSVPQAAPRIAPLPRSQWTAGQQSIVESLPESDVTNATATLLRNPVLLRNIAPFERYIAAESTLDARDRELLILRTAWLARSDYVWAHHVGPARQAGITEQTLRRIAAGPDAPGWGTVEAALLRAADELHVDSFVSDVTWEALAARMSTEQMMDMLFTAGEITMIAGAVNSLRVDIEAQLTERLPSGVRYAVSARRTNTRLTGSVPRIMPLERNEWTPEIRALLDPSDSGRRIANVYRTYVHHLQMDLLRRGVSEHIREETTLSDRHRELLLIRIGVLCRSEYEWSAHSRIGRAIGLTDADLERIMAGPSERTDDAVEQALLSATDELYHDDFVADETWATLADALSTQQLLDMLIAVGGYRMFSMAMNSLGVQLDPGAARFPPELR